MQVGHSIRRQSQASRPAVPAIGLTGKPKAVFGIGLGGTGKTTLMRWAVEQVINAGAEPSMAAMDSQNRDLRNYFDGVLKLDSYVPAEVAKWLEDFLSYLMKTKGSALLDMGGGDTALGSLIASNPDIVQVLGDAGGSAVPLVHDRLLRRGGRVCQLPCGTQNGSRRTVPEVRDPSRIWRGGRHPVAINFEPEKRIPMRGDGRTRSRFTRVMHTSIDRPYQSEHDAKNGAESQDRQGELHPDPEIPDGRFNPVAPGVGQHAAAAFNDGINAALPPSEIFWPVEPEIAKRTHHRERGPEPEEIDPRPAPGASN